MSSNLTLDELMHVCELDVRLQKRPHTEWVADIPGTDFLTTSDNGTTLSAGCIAKGPSPDDAVRALAKLIQGRKIIHRASPAVPPRRFDVPDQLTVAFGPLTRDFPTRRRIIQ